MKTIINIFAASLIVLLAACSKDQEATLPVNSPKVSLRQASATVDPCANPNNPFDSIGRLHNVLLDSLRHHVKATGDTTKAGMLQYLSDYIMAHYGKPFKKVDVPELQICLDYKSVLLTQNVSKTAQGFFVELSNTLDGVTDLEHYNNYKEQIVATENKIVASKLPAAERTNLLMTASLLRYSGYFWMEAFKNGDVGQQLSLFGIFRKIAGVIAGIGADATTIAYSYFLDPINVVGNTVDMSAICGYYTGWY